MSLTHYTRTSPVRITILAVAVAAILLAATRGPAADDDPAKPLRVGVVSGGIAVPTGQIVRPAGQSMRIAGRPVDLALSPDGKTLLLKTIEGLIAVDTATWQATDGLAFPSGQPGSMHGLAVSRDGEAVYVSGAHRKLFETRRDPKGRWQTWSRAIALGAGEVNPCGVALLPDGRTACVALSIRNELAMVDLAGGKVDARIPTGVCPVDVLVSTDGRTAYVSNFGGRRAKPDEHAELSAGTRVVVDPRSISASGTISRIDLAGRKPDGQLEVGLHPAGMALGPDGRRLYVANANSDSVSVVDTAAMKVLETISVRPDPQLPFGSITNAVALARDGRTLWAANGGNNALAAVELSAAAGKPSQIRGFVPTAWFPGAVCCDDKYLYIASVKGIGSLAGQPDATARNSKQACGTLARVEIPSQERLAAYTRQVLADGRVPQMLQSQERKAAGVKPRPVPRHAGEPSTIEHVVYVIKENRTYDQVFGDLAQGDGERRLCIYGRKVTPNHHALAEEFVLLDNYYCNGIVSADGHQWATQGAVTDYQEKAFGGHVRGYDFGRDPLCYANCNFLWDAALLAGRSFRNYGEFDFPRLKPGGANWFDVYRDFRAGAGKIRFRQSVAMETLRKYTCGDYPGWNLAIPDALRIEAFVRDFKRFEQNGQWPSLVIVYLPQDHTGGVQQSFPSPRACVADNDLALGRLVEVISHSRYWPTTAIFVNEDDPQDGWDHVDGHRSLCLVVSPYSKRRAVVSRFYNQLSVLHTMERMLGLGGTAQLVAAAPTMEACFADAADLTPYTAKPNTIPLDEPAVRTGLRGAKGSQLARAAAAMDLSQPDRIDDDLMNRILWHASRGMDSVYPVEFAGAHGRGLSRLHLKAEPTDD